MSGHTLLLILPLTRAIFLSWLPFLSLLPSSSYIMNVMN